MKKLLAVVSVFVSVSSVSFAQSDAKIEKGKKVKFDYTLTVDGQVVETSKGKVPLEYVHGEGKIILGLEKALAGMKVGDTKKVKIEPKDAYGEINNQAYRELPKTSFPANFEAAPGMVIELKDPDGNVIPAIVWEVKEQAIVLNFNHPLAGKTLEFDVKIVSIE